MRGLDLTGQKFGKLTAIKPLYKVNGGMLWECKCDCGNSHNVIATRLFNGHVKSCGCYRVEFRKLLGTDAAKNRLILSYKMEAKKRNLHFLLTDDEFFSITDSNCYYCGVQPLNVMKPSHYDNRDPERWYVYNGVDRVDNSKGYVKENCVPCCSLCNMAKCNMTIQQFREWIERVYKHQFTKFAEKTPAIMMDELFTVNMKLWFEQEKLLSSPKGSGEADEHAKKAQELNAKRNRLMRGLDGLLNFSEGTLTEKSYG